MYGALFKPGSIFNVLGRQTVSFWLESPCPAAEMECSGFLFIYPTAGVMMWHLEIQLTLKILINLRELTFIYAEDLKKKMKSL